MFDGIFENEIGIVASFVNHELTCLRFLHLASRITFLVAPA
jgi:hypothetical protein